MSIKALDRAQDAYNLAKKRAVQEKVIVFSVPSPKTGRFPLDIRFPYTGTLKEVYASCSSPGTEDTVFKVERCKQENFNTNPVWEEVSESVTLAAGDRSVTSYGVTSPEVNEGDHFSINFHHRGGATGMVVELVIEIK